MEAFNQRPRGYTLSEPALRLFESVVRGSDPMALVASIATLSAQFTKNRARFHAAYLDTPHLAAGYAAYFLPVNFAKLQVLLGELPEDWADRDRLAVLDVGAGPGTASLAVLDWLCSHERHKPSLDVTALDHSEAALAQASTLWERYRQEAVREARLRTSVMKLDKLGKPAKEPLLPGGPYDLIVVANCLNELFRDSKTARTRCVTMMENLLAGLKADGSLLILEPALRTTARALHEIRDQLLAKGMCTVYSPCLHEAPCPALIHSDDWCHEERAWTPPPWIVALDRNLGFIKDALKFSYLIARKDGRTIVPRLPDVYRIVSELRVFKGEKRVWVCNKQGRAEIGRLDRKASGANAEFDRLRRGTLVHLVGIERKEQEGRPSGLGRIAEDSTVHIIREAQG